MLPVSEQFPVTQGFGEGATAGVVGNPDGSPIEQLVAEYGNYQPFGHAGEDRGCPVGTEVHAVRAGTVVWADWDVNLPGDDSWGPAGYFARWAFYRRFGGRILLLQHGPSDFTAYCHLSEFKAGVGQYVNEGAVIALSGDSSAGQDGAIAPHLHTEHLIDTSYSTGNGLIYGRTDPAPLYGGSGITTNSLTTALEGSGLMATLDLDDRQFLQAVVHQDTDRMILDNRAQIAAAAGSILKAIAASTWDIKTFSQASDNFTGDRAITDQRQQIAAAIEKITAEMRAEIHGAEIPAPANIAPVPTTILEGAK